MYNLTFSQTYIVYDNFFFYSAKNLKKKHFFAACSIEHFLTRPVLLHVRFVGSLEKIELACWFPRPIGMNYYFIVCLESTGLILIFCNWGTVYCFANLGLTLNFFLIRI